MGKILMKLSYLVHKKGKSAGQLCPDEKQGIKASDALEQSL